MDNLLNPMSKDRKIQILGIIIILLTIIIGTSIIYFILNKKPDSKIINSTSSSSSQLPQPKDIDPIPKSVSSTPMRVDYSKSKINEVISKINQNIKNIKQVKNYEPSIKFCDGLASLVYSTASNVNPLKLDINYNSLAPTFEKIYTDGKVILVGCEQHLSGSTGAFDEYKKAYSKYINELTEIKNID